MRKIAETEIWVQCECSYFGEKKREVANYVGDALSFVRITLW